MSVMKKPTKINIKFGPILSITKKTFFVNLCTPAKLIGSIIIITFVPILFIFMIPPYLITSTTSLTEQLGVIMFFYSFGLMYPIAIGTSAAPLIAEEVSSGTMLTLVSKPIKRIGIVTGKFMALIIFGILLSLISLIFISVFALIRHPFYDILIFIELNLIYSIIIIIFFGGLTLGFSALFKRARNVTIIPIIIVIFSFLILMIAKQLLTMSAMYSTEPSYYEQLQLYHFDISFHLANIYSYMAEILVPTGVESWGMFFLIMGVTKNAGISRCQASGSCSLTLDTIRANYYFAEFSNLFLIVIGIGLLIAGIYYLKNRDIS